MMAFGWLPVSADGGQTKPEASRDPQFQIKTNVMYVEGHDDSGEVISVGTRFL